MSSEFTQDDADKLQELLIERMEREEAMPMDMVHGYLTATITGPRAVPESEWLDVCLMDKPGDATLSGLLRAFHASIADDLANTDYGPLIIEMPRDDGTMLPLPYGWCQGYIMGIDAHGEEAQDAMLGDETASALLTPIFAFLMYEEEHLFNPPNEAEHRAAVGDLAGCALELYRWWQSRN